MGKSRDTQIAFFPCQLWPRPLSLIILMRQPLLIGKTEGEKVSAPVLVTLLCWWEGWACFLSASHSRWGMPSTCSMHAMDPRGAQAASHDAGWGQRRVHRNAQSERNTWLMALLQGLSPAAVASPPDPLLPVCTLNPSPCCPGGAFWNPSLYMSLLLFKPSVDPYCLELWFANNGLWPLVGHEINVVRYNRH